MWVEGVAVEFLADVGGAVGAQDVEGEAGPSGRSGPVWCGFGFGLRRR